jgi:spermidine synthase
MILLAYQGAFGQVYERVALLTALFMAGSAGGAWLVRDVARPLSALKICEAAAATLLLAVPLFLRHEAMFVVVMTLMGALGGAVFGAAANYRGVVNAGRLYGLDLAGSFFGALLTAIILVPLFGIQNTLFVVVSLKIMSLIVLVSIGHEET